MPASPYRLAVVFASMLLIAEGMLLSLEFPLVDIVYVPPMLAVIATVAYDAAVRMREPERYTIHGQ